MAPLAIAAPRRGPQSRAPSPGLLPLAGIACDSEAGERQLELGHRALDLAKPRAVEEQACATECASLDGCAFFHVMTSDGCMVEGGAKVCSPWAECTYFSECSPIKPDDEGLWTANVHVLRARAPASWGWGERPLPAAFFKSRVGIDVATYPAGRDRHLEPDHEGRAPRARPPPPAPRMLVRERRHDRRTGRHRAGQMPQIKDQNLVLPGRPVVRRTWSGDSATYVEEHQWR